ncbi:DUF3099 domain-containing protein [Dietzia timorensis]|uniref:DUF3099 domain-containing protein n=1 Tax=Dietzia timorensis TaxID=499555 RepID=A0A173LL66_9ACTN|nr:DUF3099 domain-containing protein [Dietzia timorensis]ANI92324.1 Hypothetical protein BJL86_1547 [Dietzia timorensis]
MATSRRGHDGRFHRKDEDDTSSPVLITAARKPYEEELADRKRRYFFLMSLRIPALLFAAIAFMIWDNGWIALAIIAGSIPIPWIAVLGANDRPRRSKKEPRGYARGSLQTTPLYRQIGPGGVVYTSAGTQASDTATNHDAPRYVRPPDDNIIDGDSDTGADGDPPGTSR